MFETNDKNLAASWIGQGSPASKNEVAAYLNEEPMRDGPWAPVAYFSMEFGLHETLPIYSGGLGVLAGDHLKSASDLGLPLVAVGLFYRQSYFVQSIGSNGWQVETYPDLDPTHLPLHPVMHAGERLRVSVPLGNASVAVQAWRVDVGRVPLYLLDADLEANHDVHRRLTDRLYGGDPRMRIQQELILGVGGLRLLSALGITPGFVHLNEGHCAFAVLERARLRVAEGASFEHAFRAGRSRTLFTTHTPVEAGHDRFDASLATEHLAPLGEELGVSAAKLMDLGRVQPGSDESFCMTVLGLRAAGLSNGVSKLHGEVSREMWRSLIDAEAAPRIGHITNGVHVPTWVGQEYAELFDRVLGAGWHRRQSEGRTWSSIENVSDAELREAKAGAKARLSAFLTERTGASPLGDAMVIGFARRFATYKRATLLFDDVAWLSELLSRDDRPLRVIFAGKAHPRDDGGKRLLQAIVEHSRQPGLAGRVHLIPNYDMEVGRHLVQGVDLWLNNPRRPHEASGTSGQKVIYNGGLNCSILDGWWAEAYDGRNGFAIGDDTVHADAAVQDAADAKSLRDALEGAVNTYFDAQADWCDRVRHSIRTLASRFNSDRMVAEYIAQLDATMPVPPKRQPSRPISAC
ncbi:MAG: alpha-glucan family phosphorylase [Myxococcota bacterium]